MSPEEKIKFWHDDSADHALVWASDWNPFSQGIRRECELCGKAISVWPVVAKSDRNPLFHILCKSSCMALCLKVNGPVPYGGRITNNTLPDRLEKF